jgi:hypothetical protein
VKALGPHMDQETVDELTRIERHGLLAAGTRRSRKRAEPGEGLDTSCHPQKGSAPSSDDQIIAILNRCLLNRAV